jgi:hypothetical protein
MRSENADRGSATALPHLCFIRHPTTGETVEIRRGETGYHPANTKCSPDCLNSKLPQPPTPEQVFAMKHGSLMGWDTKGANPAMWTRAAEAGAR